MKNCPKYNPKYMRFRAYVPELASQFREGELILRLEMKGVAINYQSGFTTDIAESCIWLTPFIKKPGNFWDLRYLFVICVPLRKITNKPNINLPVLIYTVPFLQGVTSHFMLC